MSAGVGGAGAALSAVLYLAGLLEPLEMLALDLRFRAAPRHASGSPADVVIVTVDQGSIEFVEERLRQRWPWPRQFHGKMIDYFKAGGARAVVFDLFFTEPDINRADVSTEESDAAFEDATARAGNVFHAVVLQRRGLAPVPDELAAATNRAAALPVSLPPGWPLQRYAFAALPSARLQHASRGLGFANVSAESDNVIRRVPAVAALAGQPVMSLALATAWDLSGRPPVRGEAGHLRLGSSIVPVDRQSRVWLWWYRPSADGQAVFAIPGIANAGQAATILRSAVQMELGRPVDLPAAVFSNKIVLVGSSAPGLLDMKATPLGEAPGVHVQATALANMLRGDAVTRADRLWALLFLVFASLAVAAACHDSRHAWIGACLTVVILSAVAVGGWALLIRAHVFLDVVPSLVGGLATFLAVNYANYLAQRRNARVVRDIFEHYLDSSVVQTLIHDPSRVRLGGERREATVLFCDVAGFTSISEGLDPEALVHFMNRYLDAMTDVIIGNGGFVDKFVGDEIVAIFGAPNDVPDHAVRACESVVRMAETLRNMQDEFRSMGAKTEVFCRTGLSTGPMIVGNMGSESRMNYTAMGDTVNLGARIEGVAKVYGVRTVVSERTQTSARERYVFRELDRVRVKGKALGVPIHELVGRRGEVSVEATARFDAFALGLAHYRARRWAEAMEVFAADVKAGDGPSAAFVARCCEYQRDPPPEGWDGVYTMLSK
jgi:adenylate cyclase